MPAKRVTQVKQVKQAKRTPLAEILAAQIKSQGPITFAEYMDACLYHPQHGYYMRENQAERRDYVTSVDVSPIFGRLLAMQFSQMWELLGRPDPFVLVEAGGGTGRLALHVLDCVRDSLNEFHDALHYIAVERSPSRSATQGAVLTNHVADGHFVSMAELPTDISEGCIFSNELIDAFPVHRVVMEGGKLRELYVTLCNAGFCEELGDLSSGAISQYFEEQGITLREDQTAEMNLAARGWMEHASSLRRGFLLTIDYGYEVKELYDERHMRGTLLAYDRHHTSEDFYRAPGEQDLTAHVNFTALDLWGLCSGFERNGFTSQTNFLLALARCANFEDLEDQGADERHKTVARSLFKTLIHPEGMGETFRVLAQQKGVHEDGVTGLAGFDPL